MHNFLINFRDILIDWGNSMSNHPDHDTLKSQLFFKLAPLIGIVNKKSWKFQVLTPYGSRVMVFKKLTKIAFSGEKSPFLNLVLLLWFAILLGFSLKIVRRHFGGWETHKKDLEDPKNNLLKDIWCFSCILPKTKIWSKKPCGWVVKTSLT